MNQTKKELTAKEKYINDLKTELQNLYFNSLRQGIKNYNDLKDINKLGNETQGLKDFLFNRTVMVFSTLDMLDAILEDERVVVLESNEKNTN